MSVMNSLPLNNLSEHLARFAASKKSTTSNQAAPNPYVNLNINRILFCEAKM